MPDMARLNNDFGELRSIVGSFLPPPWGMVLGIVPSVIKLIGDVAGDQDLSEVDWSDVDWEKYRIKGNVVTKLLKAGVELSQDEIDLILGVD